MYLQTLFCYKNIIQPAKLTHAETQYLG